MKAIKYTNYILIEGLEEHSQAYSDESFRVERLDRSSVLFLLEIVSPFSVKLNLYKEINEPLLVTVNINNNKVVLVTNKYVEDTKPEIKPEIPSDENIELDFTDDKIIIDSENPILASDISIKMKKYSLERFDDFPDERINIEFETDEEGYINKEIPFEIKKDFIYRITTKYKNKSNTRDYIHDRPTCYYSSIHHLKMLASNFDLYLDYSKNSDFDIKLLIWKYSNIAKGIAGIVGDIIYNENYSILNEYVTQKILLEIVAQSIRDTNITPDRAKETLGSIAVTLADLSHGAATTETITTQLVRVHKQLSSNVNDIEKNLRNYFSYLQAEDNITNTNRSIISRVTNFNFKGGK